MSVGTTVLCSLAAVITVLAWWRERAAGPPPPLRPWLRQELSPLYLFAAGMLLAVVLVVTALVSIGLGFETVPDALAYPAMVVGAAPIAAVGYACARWWQLPYMLGFCLLGAFLVGTDPEEATSLDDALLVASGVAVIVGVGVVVRDLQWARRRERGPAQE